MSIVNSTASDMFWSSYLLLVCFFGSYVNGFNKDPDVHRNIPEIIEARGFKAETHYVQTKDGYILGVYRIVNPFYKGKVKRPVLMLHGKMSSAIDFIINSKDENLDPKEHSKDACDVTLPVKGSGNNIGFECAKRGLDVWLLNMRGNEYSLNHTTLSPKEKPFWQFAGRQAVENDLPDTIDYILKITKQKTVAYVGHSQGATLMFCLLASAPKYNQIVRPVVLLSPVASLLNYTSSWRHVAFIPRIYEHLLEVGGPYFIPSSSMHKVFKVICSVRHPNGKSICESLPAVFGYKGVNSERAPVYAAHYNSGGSNWNFAETLKLVQTKVLHMFDHGSEEKNMALYGLPNPPKVPLENIRSAEINLIRGLNDPYVSSNDISYLKATLKVEIKSDYVVPDEEFQHMAYMYHKHAGLLVNDHVLNLLLGSLKCHQNAM